MISAIKFSCFTSVGRERWSVFLYSVISAYGLISSQTDRDRFIMSKQIKDAYLYRHRLQMKEKQIQTSKQRLTGYIFHEVRVPLNTASESRTSSGRGCTGLTV